MAEGGWPRFALDPSHLLARAAFELCEVVIRKGGKMELGNAISRLSLNSRKIVCEFGGLEFTQRYPHLFQITRKGKSKTKVVVQATMPVKFCERAGQETGCRDSRCMQLHLCPHFIKGNCTFGNKCRKSHQLGDHHTMSVLHRFNLAPIDPNSLLEFLRRIVDETEMERTAAVHSIPYICKFYNNEGGCGKGSNCPFLHVCKHFVEGDCKFGTKCIRDHNFKNRHNKEVLKEYSMADLNERRILGRLQIRQPTRSASLSYDSDTDTDTDTDSDKSEIRKLPMRNETESIPDICKFYNTASKCSKDNRCPYLHVCKHFVEGGCKFGSRCIRDHNFRNNHNKNVLQNCNMDNLNEQHILDRLQGRGRNRTSSSSSDSGIAALPKSPIKKTATREPDDEVCGYHLKGKCYYGDNCIRKHTDLPYLWQYQFSTKYSQLQGDSWNDFPDDVSVKIEECYSRPQNDGYSVNISGDIYQIAFTNEGNMKAKPVPASSSLSLSLLNFLSSAPKSDGLVVDIKRMSTTSSAVSPPGHVFSTSWIWYWKDEFNKWQSYDHDTAKDGHPVSDTDSKVLEKEYMSGQKFYKFSAAKHSYTMFLKEWYQQNDHYTTKREVRRRPKLVTKEMMKTIAQGPKPDLLRSDSGHSSVPSHWDPVPPGTDYILVQQFSISDEYKKTEAKFLETMKGHRIVKIERVQNIDLWTDFIQKQNKLTKKTGSPPEERQLFHGTNSEIIKAICQQGFDWRVCGKHGKAYGSGSYFATTAVYSHSYTKKLSRSYYQHKQMFLSRVIVGSFAVGNSSMVKPPPKDPRKPYGDLYDSCVDATSNPAIFVVFENGQSYPEFLITYM